MQPEVSHCWDRPAVRAGGIVLLTLGVYVPAMRAEFVWNDDTFLYDNPRIHAADGLYRFWFTAEAPDYFPLVSTTLWLEWRLWGTDARGYHVVNVLLHAVSSVLLWRAMRRLAIPGAWWAAMIFAVHPVNVESVAWITERKNTLPMAFYALTLLWYLRFEREGRRRWYGLSLAAFSLALLGKTSVVMLPFVLLGCAWWQRGRIRSVDLRRSVPFYALALVLGLVTVWFQYERAIGSEGVRTDPFPSRLAIAGRAVWFYLWKALVPYPLCFAYPRWQVDAWSLWAFIPLIALVLCLVLFARYRRTWGRPFLAGLGYFVVTLLPVLGFLNIYFMRYSLVADHWQYTSLPGIIALVVGLGAHFSGQGSRQMRGLAGGFAAAVTAWLATLSYDQAGAYRNEETLFRDTVAKNPSAWLAHNNLGRIYHGQGRYAEALAHFDKALDLKPDYALAHYNLGNVWMDLGDLQGAVRHYEESARLEPRSWDTYDAWGMALAKLGRLEEARQRFLQAVRLAPNWIQARVNLGQVYAWLGRPQEAILQFRTALIRDPNSAEAHYSLGMVWGEQGRPDVAAGLFDEAVRLKPEWAEAHNNLGRALASQGHPEQAVEHYQTAICLSPRFFLAYRNLGEALAELGRFDESVAAYKQAAALEPTATDVHYGEKTTRPGF